MADYWNDRLPGDFGRGDTTVPRRPSFHQTATNVAIPQDGLQHLITIPHDDDWVLLNYTSPGATNLNFNQRVPVDVTVFGVWPPGISSVTEYSALPVIATLPGAVTLIPLSHHVHPGNGQAGLATSHNILFTHGGRNGAVGDGSVCGLWTFFPFMPKSLGIAALGAATSNIIVNVLGGFY